MKTTLLLLFSFVVISTCSAQISAGTVFVGGSASFFSRTAKSSSNPNDFYKMINTYYSLNPKAGYFISNNLAVGLGIDYYNDKFKNKGDNPPEGSLSRSIGIRPFSRYYKMLGERAGFFGQLAVYYSKGKTKYGDVTSGKSTYFGAGIAPGFVFFATPKIGIETTIGNFGYWHSKTKSVNTASDENSSNQLEASVNASNVLLGINFYLSR